MTDTLNWNAEAPHPSRDPRSAAERTGLHDGALGQTWREYQKVLAHEAEEKRIRDACETEKRIEIETAALELATEHEGHTRREHDRVETLYRMVADDNDRKPSSYSAVWGLVFLSLAVLLVVADFPLTRQIVSAMSIGSDTNWTIEQMMVSIGIVAISLFFKLLTDPFTQPQYLMSAGHRRTMQVVSVVAAIGLLVGVVYMLVQLGRFRAQAVGVNAGTAAGPEPSTTTSTGLLGGSALESYRDETFVIMSLILPIIGGIFASVGFSRLHNAGRLWYLSRKRRKILRLLGEAASGMQTAAAAVRSSRHELEAVKERRAAAGGLFHTYLHAYQTGFVTPDRERPVLGMATRLREVVEKWTAIVDQSQNFVRTDTVSLIAGPANPAGGDSEREETASPTTTVVPVEAKA